MKHQITQILNRHIVADATVMSLVQIACYVAGLFVFALSAWKLLRLDLNEAQLFFGVLLSFVTPLLLFVIGLLLPILTAIKKV